MKTFRYKNYFSYHRGVALLIAVMILTSALAIALGIYNIYSGEILLSEDARESYKAFYAANTGVECIIYYSKYPPNGYPLDNYNFFLPPMWQAPMWPVGDPRNTKPITCGGRPIAATLDSETVVFGEITNRVFSLNMNDICTPQATLTLESISAIQYRGTIEIEGVNFNPGYACGSTGGRNQVQRGLLRFYTIQKPI